MPSSKKDTAAGVLWVKSGEFRLQRIFCATPQVNKLPCGLRLNANSIRANRVSAVAKLWDTKCVFDTNFYARGEFVRPRVTKHKKDTPLECLVLGDSWENRTPVSALRGPCLSRLTTEPFFNAWLFYHSFSCLSSILLKYFSKSFVKVYKNHRLYMANNCNWQLFCPVL